MQRRQSSPIPHRARCPALLCRYYVSTDRFYNGNLTRNARQIELPPEVAAHLHPQGPQGPQGRTLQHGAANLRKAKRASIAECPKVVPLGSGDSPSEPSLPSRAGNADASGNGDGDAKRAPPKPALRKMTTAIPRAARAAAEVGT